MGKCRWTNHIHLHQMQRPSLSRRCSINLSFIDEQLSNEILGDWSQSKGSAFLFWHLQSLRKLLKVLWRTSSLQQNIWSRKNSFKRMGSSSYCWFEHCYEKLNRKLVLCKPFQAWLHNRKSNKIPCHEPYWNTQSMLPCSIKVREIHTFGAQPKSCYNLMMHLYSIISFHRKFEKLMIDKVRFFWKSKLFGEFSLIFFNDFNIFF